MAEQEEHGDFRPRCKEFCGYHWKGLMTVIFPIVILPILFIRPSIEFSCLYVLVLMTTFWISEVVPLYVTSLLPIVFFPPMGILDSNVVCQQYFKDTLVMFIGSIMVALSIEYCNLHRRIALRTILIVGCTPSRILLGVMSASWFMSMWISNSACTAMMCPIIRAVLEELESEGVCKMYRDPDPEKMGPSQVKYPSRIATCLYLSSAYAGTIGGCGTIIGTGTNLTLKGLYDSRFPHSVEQINFPKFMIYMIPPMLVLVAVTFVWMNFLYLGLFRPNSEDAKVSNLGEEGTKLVRRLVVKKVEEIGTITFHEVLVTLCFAGTVLVLFFRRPGFIEGWYKFFSSKINPSLPMTSCLILLFLIPIHLGFLRYCCRSGPFSGKATLSLITWPFLNSNVPWGLLFLLGGGFAMAAGCIKSGMSLMLAQALQGLSVVPLPVIQLLCIMGCVFLSAFCANVPVCNILIPILAELAVAVKVHPLYLMFPAGVSCSMAFVLPVSTPPNAIVAGYANVRGKDMALAGMFPTVTSILIIFVTCQTWHYVIYPTSRTFPDWATQNGTENMFSFPIPY